MLNELLRIGPRKGLIIDVEEEKLDPGQIIDPGTRFTPFENGVRVKKKGDCGCNGDICINFPSDIKSDQDKAEFLKKSGELCTKCPLFFRTICPGFLSGNIDKKGCVSWDTLNSSQIDDWLRIYQPPCGAKV